MHNPVLCYGLSFLQCLKPFGNKNKSGGVGCESDAESVLQDRLVSCVVFVKAGRGRSKP